PPPPPERCSKRRWSWRKPPPPLPPGPRSQRPRFLPRRRVTPASLGLADATGAAAIRIGPRTYSITGPPPPPPPMPGRRGCASTIGEAVDSTGVTNALLGGSIARRLRRRRRRRRLASAAEADGPVSSWRCGRCLGCLG